jgi:hypothetical protein
MDPRVTRLDEIDRLLQDPPNGPHRLELIDELDTLSLAVIAGVRSRGTERPAKLRSRSSGGD